MIQQAIIRYMVPTAAEDMDEHGNIVPRKEDIRFVLRTDGTGILTDLYYDDNIDITHDLDLLEFSRQRAVVLTKPKTMPYESVFNNFPLAENECTSEDDPKLEAAIAKLFNQWASKLQNPIGIKPSDEGLSLARGDQRDLYKALAAISYLASTAGLSEDVVLVTGLTNKTRHPDIDECAEELEPILHAILRTYEPRSAHYSYIDQNDGRITAYEAHGTSLFGGPHEVAQYFPTVRDRLEAKIWLRDLFERMDMNPALVDITFPSAS